MNDAPVPGPEFDPSLFQRGWYVPWAGRIVFDHEYPGRVLQLADHDLLTIDAATNGAVLDQVCAEYSISDRQREIMALLGEFGIDGGIVEASRYWNYSTPFCLFLMEPLKRLKGIRELGHCLNDHVIL